VVDVTESGLPRVLAIAWGMEVAPSRGPKRELSHEAIVDAAIELADAGGLAAVTMAKVAEALGFTTMSLYRYVSSKDELIMLMQDAVLRTPEVLPVDGDDWRTGLRDCADILRGLYTKHPWMVDMPLSLLGVLMPNSMKFADAAYRAMRTLPADVATKQATLMTLSMLARVFGQLERDLRAAGRDAELTPSGFAALAEVVTAERFPALAPVFLSGAYSGQATEPADGVVDDFELGFDLLLDGLAAHVAEHPSEHSRTGAAEPRTPGTLAAAEHELRSVIAQRRAAQARVKELERREREAQKARERAKRIEQG
jgi:AcrR family transcriptional regulator